MDGPSINGRKKEDGQGGELRGGASACALHTRHGLLHVDLGHEYNFLVDLEPL